VPIIIEFNLCAWLKKNLGPNVFVVPPGPRRVPVLLRSHSETNEVKPFDHVAGTCRNSIFTRVVGASTTETPGAGVILTNALETLNADECRFVSRP